MSLIATKLKYTETVITDIFMHNINGQRYNLTFLPCPVQYCTIKQLFSPDTVLVYT